MSTFGFIAGRLFQIHLNYILKGLILACRILYSTSELQCHAHFYFFFPALKNSTADYGGSFD